MLENLAHDEDGLVLMKAKPLPKQGTSDNRFQFGFGILMDSRMRTLLIAITATLLIGCTNGNGRSDDPKDWKPGRVLDESTSPLGNGYKVVSRSVVNPPGHWEGVGHFSFVYFRDVELCQCSGMEVPRSPDGRYALFVDDASGALTLFNSRSRQRVKLSDEHVGTPVLVNWALSPDRASVRLHNYRSSAGAPVATELEIDLPQ